ncbi:hydroxymethylbilane synthase [Blattabacterium cuenoti]|uniref:hydroxymethylbilane synthase n=1 Tax=Blattabacterium cuenoti TaxID=1653831 RepID=UPI00163CC3BF|nr:hydroxymethylbilane synthase [Blattabacterium cuenoti]
MEKIIRIGTRDTPLAIYQAKKVQYYLHQEGYPSKLFLMKSEGDLIQNMPIHTMNKIGVFTKKLTNIMLSGKIDMVVHSLKDVPIHLPNEIVLSAFLKRGSPLDLLVYKGSSNFLYNSNTHAIIATGSLRRAAFWKNKYPYHTIIGLRGNINTRLKKLSKNPWNAAIFAQVGLERLGLLKNFKYYKLFSYEILDWMIPSPGQGIIVISTLKKNNNINLLTKKLDDKETRLSANIERQFLSTLSGGCMSPIGGHAVIKNKIIYFTGVLLSLDGVQKIKKTIKSTDYKNIGFKCAKLILKQGGGKILEENKKIFHNKL